MIPMLTGVPAPVLQGGGGKDAMNSSSGNRKQEEEANQARGWWAVFSQRLPVVVLTH